LSGGKGRPSGKVASVDGGTPGGDGGGEQGGMVESNFSGEQGRGDKGIGRWGNNWC
jgi:hypothetical protein